jgi:PIN domain nuclease of toxin-antitoxin system
MILLDSHIVIWLALSPERISKQATKMIGEAESSSLPLTISAVSLYEIAYAIQRGRIKPLIPSQAFLSRIRTRFQMIPTDDKIAVCGGELGSAFHGDPIDRLIVASAIIHNCTLITGDRQILRAKVCKTLW